MPLTRNFYSLAAFAAGLHSAIYLIQGIVYYFVGQQVYGLKIFFPWFLFSNALLFLGSLVYVNYFKRKELHLAYWTIVANVASALFLFIVFFGVFMGMREWIPLGGITQAINLATTILVGLCFIFARVEIRYWMKAAGLIFVIVAGVLLSATLWYLTAPSSDKVPILEETLKWFELFGCLGPLMLMIHFLEEQRRLRPEDEPYVPTQTSHQLINVLKPIAVIATLFFALKIFGETVERVAWEKQLVAKTKHWEDVWGARTFVGIRGEMLRYQLVLPEDMDSARTYPLVVCLPYSGGIEGAPPAKHLLTETNRNKYPAFLFVPFCPNGSGWGGIPNYPTMDTLVFQAIEAVEKEFNQIDAKRVYVTGVSRGGYGSWHFISLRPDLFAAAMPVCGGGNPAMAPNITDVSVWAFHGEDDINVPVSGSRDMVAAIKQSGGQPRYTEFPDTGHDIWHYVTQTPGVFDWLFQQAKE